MRDHGLISVGAEIFSNFHFTKIDFEKHPEVYNVGVWGSFPESKHSGHGADHLLYLLLRLNMPSLPHLYVVVLN